MSIIHNATLKHECIVLHFFIIKKDGSAAVIYLSIISNNMWCSNHIIPFRPLHS
jgi:hypothetical protein